MSIEIAIPYWGEPQLLFDAVSSVLDQTDPDWQLLVVDDCYPAPAVAAWFDELPDARIRYVRNESNVGIAGNFQRCLDLAIGDRVTFMGCDDLLKPEYVALVRELAAIEPPADLIQVGVQVIDEEGEPFEPLSDQIKTRLRRRHRGAKVLQGEELAASLLLGNWFYWPSLSFRREALVGRRFRQDLPIILDLALILDVIADGGAVRLDDRVGFSYRRHRHSLSSTALMDGTRFADERRFFAETSVAMRGRQWTRAGRAARLHPTSRLYAASLIPEALRHRDPAGAGRLVRHVVG